MDTNYPNKLDNTLTKRLICKTALSFLTIMLLATVETLGQAAFTATCYDSEEDIDNNNSFTIDFNKLEDALTDQNYYDEGKGKYPKYVRIVQNSNEYNFNYAINSLGQVGQNSGCVDNYILDLKKINFGANAIIINVSAEVVIANIDAYGVVKLGVWYGNPFQIVGGTFHDGVEFIGNGNTNTVTSYIYGGTFMGENYALKTSVSPTSAYPSNTIYLNIENSLDKDGTLVSPKFTASNGPAVFIDAGIINIYGGHFEGSDGHGAIETTIIDSKVLPDRNFKFSTSDLQKYDDQFLPNPANNNIFYLSDNNNNLLPNVVVEGSYLELTNNNQLYFKYGERQRGARSIYNKVNSLTRKSFEKGWINIRPQDDNIYNISVLNNESDRAAWIKNVSKVVFDEYYTNNEKPTSCAYWFKDFTSLKTIDLSSIDMSKVTDMTKMFYGCNNLSTILVSYDWMKPNLTILGDNMFYGCTEIIGDKGTTYNSSETDITYAHIDGGTEQPGYFTTGEYKLFYKWADKDNEYQKYEPISYEYSSETLNIKNPTRENYDFSHWTCKPAIGDVSTQYTSISIEPFSEGNRIYTMNWTVKTYSVYLPEHMEFVPPSTDNLFACDSIVTFKAENGYEVIGSPKISFPEIEVSIQKDNDQFSFIMPSASDGVIIEATVVEKVQLQIKPLLSDNDKHILFPTDWKQFCKKQETEAILKYSLSDGSGVPKNCNIIIETIEGSVNYETQNGEVHISTLPTSLGKYNCSAVFVGDEESTIPSDTIKFTLEITAARGLILQLYQNVIFVDNSSEKFETYQWYRYGEETDEKLNNGSRQYFTEPTLKGSYWALLNGNIYACPWTTPSTAKIAASTVKTYPNPAISGQPFRLEVSEFNPDTENRLVIFNSNGVIVAEMILESASVNLSLPQGIYSGAVISNGEKTSFKMMVR